ncbi:protein SENESCENCE-ASSOCIATED GENE 21, mitochondrial-like [Cynara cardunculus var. scolymus]|nr:protein SENESCENCE-ASSOCIATED GENE 21, mitochondrial-like [Cynara cardunculus var. scolymus]
MARSISNAKLVSSFIVDQCSVVARRGYAAASQGGVSENVRSSGIGMMKKVGEESTRSTPWVPDPVTGYYKPEGHVNQVDAAELRELLLKKKTRGN